MNRLIPFLVGALLCSCVSQTEFMSKVGQGIVGADFAGRVPKDSYFYHYGQIGGQGTGQSSMGTAVAFDGQKSFADFMQFAATYYTLSAATKQLLYKEVTKRYQMGQITQQQKIAADLAIAQSTTSAGLQESLAKIAAGQ